MNLSTPQIGDVLHVTIDADCNEGCRVWATAFGSEGKRVWLKASRPLREGDELFVAFGEKGWTHSDPSLRAVPAFGRTLYGSDQ